MLSLLSRADDCRWRRCRSLPAFRSVIVTLSSLTRQHPPFILEYHVADMPSNNHNINNRKIKQKQQQNQFQLDAAIRQTLHLISLHMMSLQPVQRLHRAVCLCMFVSICVREWLRIRNNITENHDASLSPRVFLSSFSNGNLPYPKQTH